MKKIEAAETLIVLCFKLQNEKHIVTIVFFKK